MKMTRALRRPRGFTILELAISLGLLASLMVIVGSVFHNLSDFFTESVKKSDMQEAAKIGQTIIMRSLANCKLMGLETPGGDVQAGQCLTFVEPVRVVDTATMGYVDDEGEVNWGAVEADGPHLDTPDDPHRLALEIIPSDVVSESSIEQDLNHDGDQSDTYRRGSLALRTTGGRERIFFRGQLVYATDSSCAFDMDGDGTPDCLMEVFGESFTDTNDNAVRDDDESYDDANGNGQWDGYLQIKCLVLCVTSAGRGISSFYRAAAQLRNN